MLRFFVFPILGYMGWSLGSNDAANIFGPGVVTKVLRFRTAGILMLVFVTLGSVLEGRKTIGIVGYFTILDLKLALLCAGTAASVITLMTIRGIPVSTSQAILGAVAGVSIFTGGLTGFPWSKFTKVIICWLGAPLGGVITSYILYRLTEIFGRKVMSPAAFNILIKWGTIIVGCYGAYTLGSNNVANVSGVFVGAGVLTPFIGTLSGGLSIALGACTYSKKVMETVGARIVPLDPSAGFLSVLAEAIVLHIFTQVGVPVSASQTIVGAVAGIGLAKGIRVINARKLLEIFVGWIVSFFLPILLIYLFLFIF